MDIKDVLNQIHANIYVTDVETGEILFVNQKMKEEYGIREPEGKRCWEVFQVGVKERCSFCPVTKLLESSDPEAGYIWLENNTKLGREFWNYDSLIMWEGKKAHMQQAYDITEMMEMTEGATRDSLCDTWNRAAGKSMLGKRLEELKADQSCVVTLLDMDNLNQINDRFGTAEGDLVLVNFCEYLNNQIDSPDFLFRLSGDKFVVVFFGKNVKTVSRLVLGWRENLEQYSSRYNKPYVVSFSYGISYTNGSRKTAMNELLDQADERMYEEKLRRRRNEVLARNEELSLKGSREKMKMDYPAEYLYDAIVRSTDDYVYICNMKTGTFQYTPAQVEEFGLPGEIVEQPLEYWREIVHPDDWERFYKSNMEISEDKRDAHYVEFRAKSKNGEYLWIRCRGHVVRDEYGEPALFAGIMHRMGGQNEIDPLTQLFNHKMFYKRIRRSVESADTEGMAVMILDVDNFRQINELYSRKMGDEILRSLAHHIQAILPDNAGLYRLDNDRMGLLVGNATEAEVRALFENIQKHTQEMKEWKEHKLEVHFSAGCTFYPQDGETVEELYQYADYALQYAKSQGKDQMVIFTEEILNKKNHRLELIKKLRDAINHGFRGFSMNYQPQMRPATETLIGAEALLRFQDEEGNSISPVEFIPIMETEGMIYTVGNWVLKTSLRAAKNWIRHQPDFSISVNASAIQFMDDSYVEDVQRILKEEDFPVQNLVIELTESSAVQNLDRYRDKYERLREIGIRVAMDDFGTGYSSLEFMKNAPIDLVKVDKGFVHGILNSKFDAAFIAFIVEISHDADLKVCQEGVETEEEYKLLREMGMDCVQGYYFGKPMEESAFTERFMRG